MTATAGINYIDNLIGKTIVARASANKLGQVHDLIADPVKGELAGLAVKMADDSLRLVDVREIYSFGPDAVMIDSDEAAVPISGMTITVEAVYESGVLKPLEPLDDLKEHERVRITV
jgi:uncharacterized protein YrrD